MSNYVTVTRGDTVPINLHFKTQAGTDIDITGWTVFFTVKKKPHDTDDSKAVIAITQTEHTAPTQGLTILTILPEMSKDLLGDYFYDIQIKRPDGFVKTVIPMSVINFNIDITRRTS